MLKPRKKLLFKSEAELAETLVAWLNTEGWEVYKEVNPHRLNEVIDIVAIKDGKIWVIETKLQYGTKVLEQAFKWKKYADLVSIGVQRSYNKNIVLDFFLRQNGIGRFWVDPSLMTSHGYVHMDLPPKLNENIKKEYIIESLHEKQKISIAGSFGGGYVTPYKLTIDQVREILKDGPKTIHQIVDGIKHHYKNRNSAIQTLAKRLLDVEDDFEMYLDGTKKVFKLKNS